MYYSATLFKAVGFDNPTATGLIIASVNFVFTCLALRMVDPIGRRRVMIFSAPGMIISLALAAISFHCKSRLLPFLLPLDADFSVRSPFSVLTVNTNSRLVEGSNYNKSWSALVLVWMITYTASYATGLGNIPWLQGELFRLEVRGIGTSLATATSESLSPLAYLSRPLLIVLCFTLQIGA